MQGWAVPGFRMFACLHGPGVPGAGTLPNYATSPFNDHFQCHIIHYFMFAMSCRGRGMVLVRAGFALECACVYWPGQIVPDELTVCAFVCEPVSQRCARTVPFCITRLDRKLYAR